MMEDFFKNIKDNPAYKTDMPPPGTVPEGKFTVNTYLILVQFPFKKELIEKTSC